MARINTNVSSLTAQRGLSRSQKAMSTTLQHLSTGLRISRGADDPAGLIASEGLRSEITGIHQAIDNSSRASNVIFPSSKSSKNTGALYPATVVNGSAKNCLYFLTEVSNISKNKTLRALSVVF